MNVPIMVNGMTVKSGDLILGDDDGVIFVPQAEPKASYEAARKKLEDENNQRGPSRSANSAAARSMPHRDALNRKTLS
jgi:4-hydroxy-4-methyl-2-oxoglutarate aldolase